MSEFYKLRVSKIERDTPSSVIISFDTPDVISKKFRYKAGQYLTFRHLHEEEELRRCYSICVPENSGQLKVGVRKVLGGAFSSFANDRLVVGDILEVMSPMGLFTLDSLKPSAHIVMFAAGSGITPIISHMETLLQNRNDIKITLIYGNKTPNSTMFREHIEELKNTYMQRLMVVNVLSSSPQDIEIFSGRLTKKRVLKILQKWAGISSIDYGLICGPEEMIFAVKEALEENGLKSEQIRYELFTATKRKKPSNAAPEVLSKEIELTVILDGTSHQFNMASNQPVLDVARANHLDAPFSCKSGICSTCRCKILEGEAEMEMNHALEDYEVEQGYALSCQLIARSKKLVISYDEGH